MIDDGYTQFHEIRVDDGEVIRLAYRPALRRERFELGNRLYFLKDDATALEAYAEEIQNRVLNFDELPGGLVREAHAAILDAVLGRNPMISEREDAYNLALGVRFQAEHPKLATISCDFCKKWWMDTDTWEVVERPRGNHVLRPKEARLLCQTHEGCPKGTPENPKGLSPKNQQALIHYLECRAVGHFPDDAIVRKNASIIAKALSSMKQFSFQV